MIRQCTTTTIYKNISLYTRFSIRGSEKTFWFTAKNVFLVNE